MVHFNPQIDTMESVFGAWPTRALDSSSRKVISSTALTHHQIQELVSKEVLELELFDQQNIHEVSDPDNPQIRYCVCYTCSKSSDLKVIALLCYQD